jgi:hypothetical protein
MNVLSTFHCLIRTHYSDVWNGAKVGDWFLRELLGIVIFTYDIVYTSHVCARAISSQFVAAVLKGLCAFWFLSFCCVLQFRARQKHPAPPPSHPWTRQMIALKESNKVRCQCASDINCPPEARGVAGSIRRTEKPLCSSKREPVAAPAVAMEDTQPFASLVQCQASSDFIPTELMSGP